MKNSVRVKVPDQTRYWIHNGWFMTYRTKFGCLCVYKFGFIPVHTYAQGQWEYAFIGEFNQEY